MSFPTRSFGFFSSSLFISPFSIFLKKSRSCLFFDLMISSSASFSRVTLDNLQFKIYNYNFNQQFTLYQGRLYFQLIHCDSSPWQKFTPWNFLQRIWSILCKHFIPNVEGRKCVSKIWFCIKTLHLKWKI